MNFSSIKITYKFIKQKILSRQKEDLVNSMIFIVGLNCMIKKQKIFRYYECSSMLLSELDKKQNFILTITQSE